MRRAFKTSTAGFIGFYLDELLLQDGWEVANIGNSDKVKLLDFDDAIEAQVGIEAKRNYMEMQKGDVQATWADGVLLKRLTGYAPRTGTKEWDRKSCSACAQTG